MECNSMATLLMLELRSHGLMLYQNVSMKLDLAKDIQNQILVFQQIKVNLQSTHNNSMIGKEVLISDSIVSKSTILGNSKVGDNCEIIRSLVGENCEIGDNCILEDVIVDHNSTIPNDTKLTNCSWPID